LSQASETGLFLELGGNEPSQKESTTPGVAVCWWGYDGDMIIFDISGSYPRFHQNSRVRWQWGPVPRSKSKSSGDLFSSAEYVGQDFAGVEHCVSLGAISEEKALEEDDLNNGANDECDMNENVRRNLPTEAGSWKNELGENDP